MFKITKMKYVIAGSQHILTDLYIHICTLFYMYKLTTPLKLEKEQKYIIIYFIFFKKDEHEYHTIIYTLQKDFAKLL